MHHPTDRITHTTAFVVEYWLEREIAQWEHKSNTFAYKVCPPPPPPPITMTAGAKLIK